MPDEARRLSPKYRLSWLALFPLMHRTTCKLLAHLPAEHTHAALWNEDHPALTLPLAVL